MSVENLENIKNLQFGDLQFGDIVKSSVNNRPILITGKSDEENNLLIGHIVIYPDPNRVAQILQDRSEVEEIAISYMPGSLSHNEIRCVLGRIDLETIIKGITNTAKISGFYNRQLEELVIQDIRNRFEALKTPIVA